MLRMSPSLPYSRSVATTAYCPIIFGPLSCRFASAHLCRGWTRLFLTPTLWFPRALMIHGPARSQSRPVLSSIMRCHTVIQRPRRYLLFPIIFSHCDYVQVNPYPIRRIYLYPYGTAFIPPPGTSTISFCRLSSLRVQLCTGVVDDEYIQSRYQPYSTGLPSQVPSDGNILLRHQDDFHCTRRLSHNHLHHLDSAVDRGQSTLCMTLASIKSSKGPLPAGLQDGVSLSLITGDLDDECGGQRQ